MMNPPLEPILFYSLYYLYIKTAFWVAIILAHRVIKIQAFVKPSINCMS